MESATRGAALAMHLLDGYATDTVAWADSGEAWRPAAVVADTLANRVAALAQGFSIETTPRQAAKVPSFAAVLPRGTRVFVAFVPGEDRIAIATLCARLVAEGMRPVPHVPARSLEDLSAFERYAETVAAAGAREALAIAGGTPEPVGKLTSSMELLESGVFQRLGFERLHVAGHPEGSPDIDAKDLAQALAYKNEWSVSQGVPLSLTTQFGFDPAKIIAWADNIAAIGNRLPIRAGLAGPASITSLLRYAKMCGVSASTQVLAKNGGRLLQAVGRSAPDGMIARLANNRADERVAGKATEGRVEALHFYPFGGFEATARWASAVADGRVTPDRDGKGFSVRD